jgi:hypothetical protein
MGPKMVLLHVSIAASLINTFSSPSLLFFYHRSFFAFSFLTALTLLLQYFLSKTCWITVISIHLHHYLRSKPILTSDTMKTSFKTGATLLSLFAVQAQAAFVNTTLVSQQLSATATTATASPTATANTTTVALNATVLNCFLTLPNDPLTAQGLSTPFLLQPPCSQTVATQQAFAEAAIYDPATGDISIYHPLVLDAGKTAGAAPVVPTLPAGAVVALWFGFNGGVLQLLDVNGQDTNNSPVLQGSDCINGLQGVQGDVFGQVSWCNAQPWFTAANAGITAGLVTIPDIGVDNLGNACPTSRSFEIVDACPSDNVPTQYLLLADGSTAQDTAANRAANPNAEVINNASDEALLANIIDPLIGCTPFLAPSVDNPGTNVPALALSELQASVKQLAPIGLVPLNDPDTLLTNGATVSTAKTNQYRLGVNQPVVAAGADSGALVPYCDSMVSVAPPFFKGFESVFINQGTPAATVGNNLFTFMCERYLMSLTQLTCPPPAFQPVVCQVDGTGAATSCVITLANSTSTNATTTSPATQSTSIAAKLVNTVANATQTSATVASTPVVATSTAALVATTTALSSTTASTSSLATSAISTQATTTVITEVVTFFIFTLSLGGAPPSVLSNNGNGFLVLEEVFVDLPSAASQACTHQFNTCVNLAGTAFSGTDCLSQMNSCNGVASTASATATTPATLTVAATVPASGSATSAAAGVLQTPAVGVNGAGAGSCPVAPALTVSACTATATVTVTASSGVAAPTLAARHLHKHLKARAF